MRDPGIDEGATTVAYVPEKGWFWYIPLADDVVSVGVVAEQTISTGTRATWPRFFIARSRTTPGSSSTSPWDNSSGPTA